MKPNNMHKIEIYTHYKIGDKFRLTDKYNNGRSAVYEIRGIKYHQFSPDGNIIDETEYNLINISNDFVFPAILRISDEGLYLTIEEKSSFNVRGYDYTIEKLDQ